MPLNEYRAKRALEKTPEPAGTVRPIGGRTFVIQKHSATRLHYDLRIEHEGMQGLGASYRIKYRRAQTYRVPEIISYRPRIPFISDTALAEMPRKRAI